MKGHLHLACALRDGSIPYLREQSFCAPMHLSKPHVDAGALVTNLVNPTAGIFDNDEISLNFAVDPGASLVLTTPSSSRVYRSRKGDTALVRQTMTVGTGGFLEFYPEPFIPHAGARYRQHNVIKVAPGGELLFFEWLSPGRVARGEAFEFEELCWDTDVWSGDVLIARERYRLRPDDASLKSLRLPFDLAHYLGCFVILPEGVPFPQAEVEALGGDVSSVYLGAAPLAGNVNAWTVKAICRDSLVTRKLLKDLRTVIYQARGKAQPTLGRY
ncbi:urease accessory protein UreD [Verrucomicrobium sp. BvORR106]|uniref:urease accessory protein UreD n=1 Tax=Verrucomicrobium sp. BvORR106 TaxID=1403819 RepID=UPI000AA68EA9|nr:urease accessory protein UreD [Verrucomicrobium sp. BvORR106]